MGRIDRFEDIIACREARKLTNDVHRLTSREPFKRDFGLRDQIQRASVSSMTNVAEGFDCESSVEFARFLGIARRSAVEVQSLLYVAMDVGYIEEPIFEREYEPARKTKVLIGGFRRSLLTRASRLTPRT
jgi:four helix bundle protein